MLLLLYFMHEKRTSHPQIPLHIFKKNRFFSFSILTDLTYYLCMGSTTFLISLYLATVQEFSATIISSILLAVPVMQGILSPLSGHISDNYQPRKIATFGLVLVFLAQIAFFFLPANAEISHLILALLIVGAGFGFFSASNKTAIMRSVVPGYHGTASSLATTVEQYGNLFSVGIASAVFALTLGNVAIMPEIAIPFLSSFHLVFLISLVLCVITIVFSILRGDLPVEGNNK